MKNLIFVGIMVLIVFGCSNQNNQKQSENEELKAETVVYSVDNLYENAQELVDKEVVIEGTVMHVCQHGGERCFLMGSNEDINIRIEAGEKIGAFSQEMMGSDLVITGILKEVKTEADAHNPGQEHGDVQPEEDAETENAHKIIAEAQEAAETVYFIEGIKVNKEL
jgi:hypothetical protein